MRRIKDVLISDDGACASLKTGKTGYLGEKNEEKKLSSPVYTEEGKKIIQANHMASAYFRYLLTHMQQDGSAYLKKRGFVQKEIEQYNFGFSGMYGNSLYKFLLDKGATKETVLATGLAKEKEGNKIVDAFWNRVMIPITNVDGYIVAFGGRTLKKDDVCKYLNTAETEVFKKGENLFMYDTARNSPCTSYILCEGYMDTLTMQKNGFTNAVASLGTSLTEYQTLMLQTKPNVYLMYDNDDAGVKATLRAIPMLKNKGIRVVNLFPYKDPDEFLQERSTEDLVDRIQNAKSAADFIREKMKEKDSRLIEYLLSA